MLHDSKEYGYRPEEIKILQNTVDLRQKKVKNEMIAIENVFMIDINRNIDNSLLDELQTHNYSKVPVFKKSRSNIVGYIKLKNLLVFKFTEKTSLKDSKIVHPIVKLNESLTLLDAIDQLKEKHVNFAMVYDESNNKATGMITLKKVF